MKRKRKGLVFDSPCYLVWDSKTSDWELVYEKQYQTFYKMLADIVDPDYSQERFTDNIVIWYSTERKDNVYPISIIYEKSGKSHKGNLLFTKGNKKINGLDKLDIKKIKDSVGYEAVAGNGKIDFILIKY